MFLHTIGYKSDKVITTALSTTTEVGTNVGDMRGKHDPKHKMTEEDLDFMEKHITSFKPQISHYRREHAPNRQYLPPELSITEMYADYVEECKKADTKELSYIRFSKLGNENCEICDSHKVHIASEARKDLSSSSDESGDERVKRNGRIRKRKSTEGNQICEEECEECLLWLEHIKRYKESKFAYQQDKESVEMNTDILFLSSDMQKVVARI